MMSIRPGEAWERPGASVAGLASAVSDRALVAIAGAAPGGAGPAGPVRLAGGDLHRVLGSPQGRPDPVAAEIDLLEVCDADTGRVIGRAAAHVVIGGWTSILWGEAVVVCNAGQIGPVELAPRAHPGDGLADVVRIAARMSARQRLAALRRARSGSHLPHPDIDVTRVGSVELTFARPMMVRLDGMRVGRMRSLRVRILPDAVTIVF
jgi:hypothetical protein